MVDERVGEICPLIFMDTADARRYTRVADETKLRARIPGIVELLCESLPYIIGEPSPRTEAKTVVTLRGYYL